MAVPFCILTRGIQRFQFLHLSCHPYFWGLWWGVPKATCSGTLTLDLICIFLLSNVVELPSLDLSLAIYRSLEDADLGLEFALNQGWLFLCFFILASPPTVRYINGGCILLTSASFGCVLSCSTLKYKCSLVYLLLLPVLWSYIQDAIERLWADLPCCLLSRF